jgi:4-hydroxy-tetrahydrodipicolinate synthase
MIYRKRDAKDYARQHLKGIWAAAMTPFAEDLSVDEAGFRRNILHWTRELGIDGLFVAGKQGEFASMSLDERKRSFALAREATAGRAGTIMSCSDQNMDTVIELGRHAESVGADFIVVHAPVLHFVSDQDEVVYEYYKHLSDKLDIGIAMWSHPDSGYLMSPELCARIAELPNIVAIKYSVPREMYVRLSAPPPRRNGSTTSSSSTGSSISARARPICCRPPLTGACAITPISRCAARSPRRKRCAIA